MTKFVKSYSNYVLKSKHQETNNGVIYERDITTIGGRDRFSKGQVPIYRSGNFVITVNNDNTIHKKTTSQEWESNESGDTWTLDILDNYEKDEKSSDDKKIVIKKDYYDLRDFAYFGSCSELIRASINDIIKKFPGELFVPTVTAFVFDDSGNTKFYSEDVAKLYESENTGLTYTTVTETISTAYSDYKNPEDGDYTSLPVMREFKLPDEIVSGITSGITGNATLMLFYVDNPYNINIYDNYVPEGSNPLKYFADGGIDNYIAYKKDENGEWDFSKDKNLILSAEPFNKYGDEKIYCPGDYMGYLRITITCSGDTIVKKESRCDSGETIDPCSGIEPYTYDIHVFMGDNNEVKYFVCVALNEEGKCI